MGNGAPNSRAGTIPAVPAQGMSGLHPGSPDGRAYWCQACTAAHQFMPGQLPAAVRLCLATGTRPRHLGRGPLAVAS